MRRRLLEAGFEPIDDTPEQFAAAVKADIRRLRALAELFGTAATNTGASGPARQIAGGGS